MYLPGSKLIETLKKSIISCQRCPELRHYCAEVAETKRKSYLSEEYWGKPVPGFGDSEAELLLVGLAPAAHGANRTGRVFTGDRSGEWLYRALFEAGFSNQSQSERTGDQLQLRSAFVTCAVKCAPPNNKPSPAQFQSCSSYLQAELRLLSKVRVILALGNLAYDQVWKLLHQQEPQAFPKKVKFSHGKEISWTSIDGVQKTLLLSYHPSQQNTFTGRLTREMFDSVFERARALLSPGKGLSKEGRLDGLTLA